MPRITVNESVTRSVSFENNLVDVQTALVRCFQFLEEKRFDEAHAIIEQVLNIDPNNTDAHVANFLCQFELTCAEDVVKNFKDCVTYEDSVFYKRVKRGTQTELAKKLDSCLRRASEQLEQFNIEEEKRLIEEEIRKKEIEKPSLKRVINFAVLGVFSGVTWGGIAVLVTAVMGSSDLMGWFIVFFSIALSLSMINVIVEAIRLMISKFRRNE